MKDLVVGDITFECLDKDDEMRIEIATDNGMFDCDRVGRYINKEHAQQIIEHLKKVFEI